MKESQAYKNAPKATKALARSLRIGDIIEAFYTDAEQGRLELVVAGTPSSKEGDQYSIVTIPLEYFGRREPPWTGRINTDRYRKVGTWGTVGAIPVFTAAEALATTKPQ